MMGVLHVVSRSPYTGLDISHCLQRMDEGDALLLIAGAVYGACRDSLVAAAIQAGSVKCYALAPDLEARGIALEQLLPEVTPIDFDGFVDLAVAYPRILSW
ncbi:MAG: sulfurtransferase complex subunit TusB [Methylohalobius sp.]|nr:sulfurtransferase complex subunit TusB [Methylohalobius sp.]